MCVGFGLLAAPNPPRSRKSSFLETGRHADFSELVDQEKLFGVPLKHPHPHPIESSLISNAGRADSHSIIPNASETHPNHELRWEIPDEDLVTRNQRIVANYSGLHTSDWRALRRHCAQEAKTRR